MNSLDLPLTPQAVEAEQSIIGGLLIDNNAFDRISDVVSSSDFYRYEHRLIFQHLAETLEANKPADLVTLAEALETAGELQNIGGLSYLAGIVQSTASAANIRRYAEIVREKSIYRALLAISSELQQECMQATTPAEQIAYGIEGRIFDLFQKQTGGEVQLHDAITSLLMEIDSKSGEEGSMSGLPTGFAHLDSHTSGLEPGQLVIVAARPSVGKSVLACNVADHVAGSGHSVLLHTMEMSGKEIGMRILAARSGVSMQSMRSGTKDNHHWDAMQRARASLKASRLVIDDRPAISVNQVRAKAKRVRRQQGLDLIVIDYLGLMTGKGDNRAQEIGSISRGLKNLAKEMNVPIIALAQLNRGVEARQDKRPLMSDLRDSGEVEQDADIILMLHREEMYSNNPEFEGIAELLIRKNRNGPTGEITLRFEKEISRLSDYEGPRVRGKSLHAPSSARRGFSD